MLTPIDHESPSVPNDDGLPSNSLTYLIRTHVLIIRTLLTPPLRGGCCRRQHDRCVVDIIIIFYVLFSLCTGDEMGEHFFN